jgi:hypothetical protein
MDEVLVGEAAAEATLSPVVPKWVAQAIGPRRVGGRYSNGYWKSAYTVLAIDAGPRESWPDWEITVQYDDLETPTTHCTAWDPQRDRVLAEPGAEAAR